MKPYTISVTKALGFDPLRVLVAVLAILCLSSVVLAQDSPSAPAKAVIKGGKGGPELEEIRPAKGTKGNYAIEINKGRLIRLSAPASAVMVADPAIADVQVISPVLVYLNGRAVGETTLFAVDNKDNEVLHATIAVTHNLSKLNSMVKALMPDAKVNFRSMDGALVMDGNANSPMDVDNIRRLAQPYLQGNQTLINMVKSNGSDQVTLMVKIAEVQRNQLKRFGIHLENIISRGSFVYGLAQGRDVVDAVGGSFLRNGSDNSVGIGFNSPNASVNGVIDALEGQGLISILAEPSLTAISGQPASFLAGGEFPIPVVGENNSVTIEYRPFGVSLGFTPTILSKDKISLAVSPEVSAISTEGSIQTQGFNIPSINTRRATTTVELGSGQSFAIAGLLQNDRSNDISKFPALGDLPVLGALFRSNEFRNDQTELVIIITPFIVSPVNEQEALTDPTKGLEVPNDLERILLGKLYNEHDETEASEEVAEANPAAGPSHMPRLHGPSGYVLK
jgi:pilus assembly protein CpaC